MLNNSSSSSDWNRWSQQAQSSQCHNGDYVMMGSMMPFDSRPVTSGALNRPVMAPFYASPPPYHHSPVTTTAPAYPQSMPYGAYQAYPSPPETVVSSSSPPACEQQYPDHAPFHGIGCLTPDPDDSNDGRRCGKLRRNCLASSSNVKSVKRLAFRPRPVVPKTITPNAPVNGMQPVEFHQPVDELMKVLQSMDEADSIVKKAEEDVVAARGKKQPETTDPSTKPEPAPAVGTGKGRAKPKQKKFPCILVPDCGKSFDQKSHRDVHERTHTGEQPFPCEWPGCNKRFSQTGNRKTHFMRHINQKPWKCYLCSKAFVQQSNLTSHVRSCHNTNKVMFPCKLDGCNKEFTQLGNLKAHQCKYHVPYIGRSLKRLKSVEFSKLSKSDQELAIYLLPLYKNTNRGIKGRGKGNKVSDPKHQRSSAETSERAATGNAPLPPPPPYHAYPPQQKLPEPPVPVPVPVSHDRNARPEYPVNPASLPGNNSVYGSGSGSGAGAGAENRNAWPRDRIEYAPREYQVPYSGQ